MKSSRNSFRFWFRSSSGKPLLRLCGIAVFVALAGWAVSASGRAAGMDSAISKPAPRLKRRCSARCYCRAAQYYFAGRRAETRPALSELIKSAPRTPIFIICAPAKMNSNWISLRLSRTGRKPRPRQALNLLWPISITAGFVLWMKSRRCRLWPTLPRMLRKPLALPWNSSPGTPLSASSTSFRIRGCRKTSRSHNIVRG